MGKSVVLLLLASLVALTLAGDHGGGDSKFEYQFGHKVEGHFEDKHHKGYASGYGHTHVKGESSHVAVEPVIVHGHDHHGGGGGSGGHGGGGGGGGGHGGGHGGWGVFDGGDHYW